MNIEITEEIARKVYDTINAGLVCGVGEPVPGKMCVEAAVCLALGLPHGDDPPCVSRALRRMKIDINDCVRWSSDQARAKGLLRLGLAQLGSRDTLDDVEFVKRVATLAIRMCVPTALRSAASLCRDAHKASLLKAADLCEREPTESKARAANAAAYAAAYADAANAAANAAYAAAAYAAASATYTYAAAAASAAYANAHAANAAAAAAYAANAAANAAAYVANANASDEILSDFAEGVVQILIEMKAPGCQWLYLTEDAA